MRKLRVILSAGALTLAGAVMVWAQQGAAASAANDDPANLKGEQVQPLRGDEIAQNVGAKALWQNLLKLKTRASLLMIVAHPDDEDGGMLTYEVRGQGARAAMLTLTRGEGGQNLMSADFNDALGLVRTEELLAADQYSGIEQMFGTEADFGFCKSREEALEKWGHERVLYDAVRAVRLFRPLVVTSVFVGGPTDGHGHHQVAGEMAQEVYNAAADPKVFPEMGLPVWAPLKVYSRAPQAGVQGRQIYDTATGKTVPLRFFNYVTQTWSDEVPPVNVVVHEGDVSDKLGMSYVEFAREGLGLQKTQIGSGVRRGGRGGSFDSRYHRWASRVSAQETEQSFFDGVDVSLAGIAALAPGEKTFLPQGLAKLQGLADAAVAGYQESAPEKSAPGLKDALVTVRGLIAQVSDAKDMSADEKYNVLHELRAKEVQANDALAEAIGLTVEAKLVAAGSVIPGETVNIQVKAATMIATPRLRTFIRLDHDDIETKVLLCPTANNCKNGEKTVQAKVPTNASITRPYFSRTNIEQPFYAVSDSRLRNAPRTPSPIRVVVEDAYEDVEVTQEVVVQTAESHPATIVPPVSVMVTPEAGILVPGQKSVRLKVEARGDAGTTVNARLKMPAGWSAAPVSAPFNGKQELSYDVTPGRATDAPVTVTAEAVVNGRVYSEGYRMGGYDARTQVAVYTPATYRTREVDVKVAPGLKVGYLVGTGDDVPKYMAEMGVTPVMLKEADLTAAGLAGLDAVVLGVRPFASHHDLGQSGLMEYVRNGGTLVVQYDTIAMPEGVAPYPFTPGGNPGGVVVEENNKVVLTQGSSAVMRWPNAITEKDFDGWVEERGHGFAQNFDPRYEAPLETHDAGQDPQRGGLLVADVGKGHYVYCAYALYRQMPESVPGAYRLFANMLSLGKAPAAGK